MTTSLQTFCGTYWYATVEQLASFTSHQQATSPEFSRRVSPGKRGDTVLEFHDLILEGKATLRSTHIEGPNAAIFNTMIFPSDVDHCPVFASEIVSFGGKPQVAVIDLQPLGNARLRRDVEEKLATLADRYGELPGSGEVPDWCEDYFTTHAIFSRPKSSEYDDVLLRAYADYLQVFVDYLKAAGSCSLPDPRTREYKDHHVANNPGLKFLGRMFGEQWTLDFLNNAMYA